MKRFKVTKKMKNAKAITLVALMVTIIVLLILAGIAISTLTGENSLLNRAKISKEKHLQSETEEKLKIKIMTLQTDIMQKEKREASLEDIENWKNQESDYYDSEIIGITNSTNNGNKLVSIDTYTFEVDEKLNVIGIANEDVNQKTETTYEIKSKDGDTMQVMVEIKNINGIEKVITPEGKEIVPQTDKKQIAIDYKIISGENYTFKVKISGSKEIKSYILKADINAKPEIEQNESYAYPCITKYGVETNKIVKIDYGDNINNYYSIDNGQTWNKYDESVKITNPCTLIVKSVIEGEITREDKKDIKYDFASNAVGEEAFDENDSTFFQAGYAQTLYVNVSEDTWNNSLILVSEGYTGIWLLDDYEKTLYFSNYFRTENNTFTIPENCTKIKIYSNQGKIYRMGIKNEPTLNITQRYPDLAVEVNRKTKPYNLVNIEYFSTSLKKLYKVDEQEWKEYNGEKIELEEGKTIYAKGIDKYNKETPISTYTSKINDDTVDFNAYDGNKSTFFQAKNTQTLYMKVGNEVWNKKLRYISEGYHHIWFLNNSGKVLYNAGDFRTTDNVFTIPEDCEKIEIYSNGGRIYEMSIE